jgi:putative transposase
LTHPWRSSGEKRTIWWYYEPSPTILQYLEDMRDAIRYSVTKSYLNWKDDGTIPSPIDLRREIKQWFDSSYDYARHHINPVCRSSISVLRSFEKNHRNKRYPQVNKLSMRLDSELVKIVGGRIRITMKPHEYEFIPINTNNKRWNDYSRYKIGEVLITDRIVSISFSIPDRKEVSSKKMGIDINFSNVTGTVFDGGIREVTERSTSNIARIQNDFSRRRSSLQKHIVNKEKRNRKLRQTRGRQRNRIRDAMHKLSSSIVREHPDASFILEDLRDIRRTSRPQSKKMRTQLNRWPYSQSRE